MYICLCALTCIYVYALHHIEYNSMRPLHGITGRLCWFKVNAVTRLLPDQYLSNSVIVFTTNLSFILSNIYIYQRVSLVVFSYLALPSKDRDVTGGSRYFPVNTFT